ncbi:TlpA family protein disulfide reductase [Thalassolituus oleivorans]|jgi:thiol-disulfide isomerase/thioredoxin|uniref:TlpA family protein disulfide reductase n=1 Tax=Thalassolituus oleivorans TaxID=187493 RepID=UPI000949419A|nr:TlpA disulfide reductase family protein [Thalassolituus oleivorans]APR67536.1 redoxin [Thalassolituus oleivorans]
MRIGVLFSLLLLTFASIAGAETKQPAPAFTLPKLVGEGTYSLSQFRGQVVYLDFWASWCGPCRKSLPLLNNLRGELHQQGFEVLAVNLDEDKASGLDFLKEVPVSYPTLHDANGTTPNAYGLRGMPTSYLIDRNGIMRAVHMGFKPSDMTEIRAQVVQLLNEKAR